MYSSSLKDDNPKDELFHQANYFQPDENDETGFNQKEFSNLNKDGPQTERKHQRNISFGVDAAYDSNIFGSSDGIFNEASADHTTFNIMEELDKDYFANREFMSTTTP